MMLYSENGTIDVSGRSRRSCRDQYTADCVDDLQGHTLLPEWPAVRTQGHAVTAVATAPPRMHPPCTWAWHR
jgi:hypothetical protein